MYTIVLAAAVVEAVSKFWFAEPLLSFNVEVVILCVKVVMCVTWTWHAIGGGVLWLSGMNLTACYRQQH